MRLYFSLPFSWSDVGSRERSGSDADAHHGGEVLLHKQHGLGANDGIQEGIHFMLLLSVQVLCDARLPVSPFRRANSFRYVSDDAFRLQVSVSGQEGIQARIGQAGMRGQGIREAKFGGEQEERANQQPVTEVSCWAAGTEDHLQQVGKRWHGMLRQGGLAAESRHG